MQIPFRNLMTKEKRPDVDPARSIDYSGKITFYEMSFFFEGTRDREVAFNLHGIDLLRSSEHESIEQNIKTPYFYERTPQGLDFGKKFIKLE